MTHAEFFKDALNKIRLASCAGDYFYFTEGARNYLSKVSLKSLTPEELELARELCREVDGELADEE